MSAFSKIFPVEIAIEKPPEQAEKLKIALEDNVSATMAEAFADDLAVLKARLDSRHIMLGGLQGVGAMGGITYDILDQQGQPIPEVVLRIDPADMVPAMTQDNPAIIKRIFTETEGYYAATIVPRARYIEFSDKKDLQRKLLGPSLAVINAGGMLGDLKDLGVRQFMEIQGIPVPVLTDLSSVNPSTSADGMGGIREFAGDLGLEMDQLEQQKPTADEMQRLSAIQQAINDRAVAALEAAGVDISRVPTRQEGVSGQEIGEPGQKKGRL